MLLKDFYILKSLESRGEGTYVANITINAAHDIFKGHFPGDPITPGVCVVQIIKELSQQIIGVPLTMVSAASIKFVAIINPELTPDLLFAMEITDSDDGTIQVKNTTSFGDTIALKLNCTYRRS